MKYFVISIIFALMIFVVPASVQHASSQIMCAADLDDSFYLLGSNIVFIGTPTEIATVEHRKDWKRILFEVEHPIKGIDKNSPSDTTIITSIHNEPQFQIDSKYLVYAGNAYGVKHFISDCSPTRLLLTEDDVANTEKSIDELRFEMSPSKQLKSGISFVEIQCKESLVLVTKHDGNPACVKPVTKQNLLDRGWANPQNLAEIRQNPESIRQNIIRMDDGRISLYPENTCASISMELLVEHDIQRYKNDEQGLGKNNTLQITDADLDEIPYIEELIYAVHLIEFPYNDFSHVYFEGIDFVEYEFFLMDKMIDKYGGTQKDYFMKLDADYQERLTNPKLQGLSNEFLAPQIVYDGKVYSIGGTVFWTSEENNLSMSVHIKDSVDESQKSVILTEDDMKSIPKIKSAIENIGTIKESTHAHKGLPEYSWNEYRDWFKQKSQERLNVDYFRLIQYDEHLYSIGFGIC